MIVIACFQQWRPCPKYQSLFNVNICIYILWLSLHVFKWRLWQLLYNVVSYIYYDYLYMFSAVATMTCPKYKSLFNVVSRNSYMYIYMYIMIIIACFQQWRLWPAPSTNHYTMSFQETATLYIMIIYTCFQQWRLWPAPSTLQSLFNVVSRNSYMYIYILWLSLHVFSSGDYDLPQVPIIIQCRFKKQLYVYIYIMIIITCFQQWRLWPAPSTNHYTMSF